MSSFPHLLRPIFLVTFVFAAGACTPAKPVLEYEEFIEEPADEVPDHLRDSDQDGFTADQDCDDEDDAIHPDAQEICDGLDNDCDALVDDEDESLDTETQQTMYTDNDGDGFGDPGQITTLCDGAQGYANNGDDCDDDDERLTPADNDDDGFSTCTGDCDDADDTLTPLDEDEDGFSSCQGDCDDNDIELLPRDEDGDGYTLCDNDCDDNDPSLTPGDEDQDGFSTCEDDCDDENERMSPGVGEICDDLDNDCDGLIDDEDDSLFPDEGTTAYLDADRDGYGNANLAKNFCGEIPETHVTNDSDCDDDDATLNLDDVDGDGYSTCDDDCDDENNLANPTETEVCDGADNDCDGITDEETGGSPLDIYLDADGDGEGDPNTATTTTECTLPTGYVTNATDCDDTNAFINSIDRDGDGESTCDGDCDDTNVLLNASDSDADGSTSCDGDCDDEDAALNPNDADNDGASTCESDCDDTDAVLNPNDNDGDGDTSCDGDCDDNDDTQSLTDRDTDGHTTCDGDCDDENGDVNPDAEEVCDTLDNNCDGRVDETGTEILTWYADNDGDGYGDSADSLTTEDCTTPIGYVSNSRDCDDQDATLTPDDDDADGYSTCTEDCDDGDATLTPNDDDADGFSTCAEDCDDGDGNLTPEDADSDGISSCDGDCDDTDSNATPFDQDGDGWTGCDGDCDDSESSAFPDNREVADDGIDQNCDGNDTLCANANWVDWDVVFPSSNSCDWGNNGNMPATDGVYSARNEELQTYSLDPAQVFCNIVVPLRDSLGGYYSSWLFAYDDALAMTYNGFVMFSTTNDWIQNLSTYGSGLGRIYDWDLIVGEDMNHGFDPWEKGQSTSIDFPSPAAYTGGTMEILMDDTFMDLLDSHATENGEIELSLITFGDNDDWSDGDGPDCYSSGMDFTVELNIAE